MTPLTPLDWNFPIAGELREVSLVPVYIEPLAHSGELLCIGMAARMGEQTETRVLPSLRRLKGVYGPAYKTLLVAAECALASLATHIGRYGLSSQVGTEWGSPVSGISLGTVITTTSRTVEQVIDVYFRAFSSLAATDSPGLSDEREERGAGISAARLERMVRELLTSVRTELSDNFNRTFQVAQGARALRLGYAGRRIVANFSLLWPTQLTGAVRSSKAKLWDLAQAREGAGQGWFSGMSPHSFELLVHQASRDDVIFPDGAIVSVNEAFAELEAEADRYDLRCRPLRGAQLMAQYLLETEQDGTHG